MKLVANAPTWSAARAKVAECRGFLRTPQETRFAEDCVVELTGLEPANKRLCTAMERRCFSAHLEATTTIVGIGGGGDLTTNVVDMGSYERHDDGTLSKVKYDISIPADDDSRPVYEVLEVFTTVKEHGKLARKIHQA
jgi:hypothetical protein